MELCVVPECGRPRVAKGWCSTHYARWRRSGDIQADKPIEGAGQPLSSCTVEGCERLAKAKGLCAPHYSRLLKHGSVRPDEPIGHPNRYPKRRLLAAGGQEGVCDVPDCPKPARARGLCTTHYARWRRLSGRGRPPVAVEELTDVYLEQVKLTDTRTWGEESYSVGVTDYGSDVVAIESPGAGIEMFACRNEEEAGEYRDFQLIGSMLAADGEVTFRVGDLDSDTVAVRMDAATGKRYSVVRIAGLVFSAIEYPEFPDAVDAACNGAELLAKRLGDGDEVDRIVGLHMLAQVHEERARAARYRTGEAIRVAKASGVIGRTGQITVTDLAERLGVSRRFIDYVVSSDDLAGKSWQSQNGAS